MKDFTFGIVTYNSERTIVETLESIKYQIEHYGKNMNFFLVLSDDCSTDKTLRVVKRWLAINSALFVDNVVLATSQNSGLCINYAQMIENIKTDYFIQIAGDDLISSCNVFKSMENLKKNEVRVYLPVYYDDKQIYVPKECIA